MPGLFQHCFVEPLKWFRRGRPGSWLPPSPGEWSRRMGGSTEAAGHYRSVSKFPEVLSCGCSIRLGRSEKMWFDVECDVFLRRGPPCLRRRDGGDIGV
jgi:hypothetical protein